MLRRTLLSWGVTLSLLGLLASNALTATYAAAAPVSQTTPSATPTPVAVDTFDPSAAGGRTVIKWYVGLGTGGNPQQVETQRAVVDQFNRSQDRIYVSLQIVDNRVASTTLATQIAAGNVPDIVGPVGTVGRATFDGNYLDLAPYIQQYGVDLSQYDPAVVNAYNLPGQGQIGIPFAVFPSFVYYNKDLFDEARLPYPPQTYGESYMGREWNIETVRDIAKVLTVDDEGNDATSPNFRPDRVVQFGWDLQYGTDPRAMGTVFGPGRLVDGLGNAQIPANWLTAWNFFYDGMFKEYWMPNDAYRNSDLFGKGNVFNSGHLAMGYTHLWYTGTIEPVSKQGKVTNWDIAVVPSYNGIVTAKLHADTFVIMRQTRNADAAFEVYRYLINNGQLLEVYGAMPAISEMQPAFFRGLDDKFAPVRVNWQVAINSLAYPDIPNHEEGMPNLLKARQATTDFETLMNRTPGLDINVEAERLQATLQGIFHEP
jgi:multiple sugar transport system substrate-binding protein